MHRVYAVHVVYWTSPGIYSIPRHYFLRRIPSHHHFIQLITRLFKRVSGCPWTDSYIYSHENSASQRQKAKPIRTTEPNVQEVTVLPDNQRNEFGHRSWLRNTFASRRTWWQILPTEFPTSSSKRWTWWLWRCGNIFNRRPDDEDTKVGYIYRKIVYQD